MFYIRCFVFAATLLVAGCYDELDSKPSTVVTDNPPEWQLRLTIDTTLDSDSGDLKTSLQAGLFNISGPDPVPTTLQLKAGDVLQATDGVQTLELEPLEDEEQIYAGTFPDQVTGQELIVSLKRTTAPADIDWWAPAHDSPEPDFGEFFIDAPDTMARMAQPFTIDAPTYIPDPDPPANGPPDDFREEYTLGTNVTLVWTPSGSGEDMMLLYGTTCGSTQSPLGVVEIDGDPGSYTTEVDDFLEEQSEAAKQDEEGCIIRLTLVRESDNLTPDPALSDDSTLVSRYSRFVEIKSVP